MIIFQNTRQLRNHQKQVLTKTEKEARRIIAEEFIKDSTEFIPKREGKLRLSQRLASDTKKGIVATEGPQARKLFFGNENWNWTTMGTGPMWYEKSKKKHKKKYKKMFIKLFNINKKRRI